MSKKLSLKRSGASQKQKNVSRDNHSQIFETNSKFLCEISHYKKSLISVFQKIFASINKIFILAGILSTKLSFHAV